MNHTYGYVKVSSKDQNENRQLIAMRDFGVSERSIFRDKQSEKDFKCPAYQKLLKKIPATLLLLKASTDFTGINEDIIGQWRVVSKDREVGIVVLDMPLLDTRQKDRNLTGTFIADLVLQILSYVAQTEHEFNRQRQAEGIAETKAKRVRFDRPPKERTAAFYTLLKEWKISKISARQASKQLGIDIRHLHGGIRNLNGNIKDDSYLSFR